MSITAMYCSNAVIMWTDVSGTTHHFMRPDPATGTMIVDADTTAVSTTSHWSYTTGVSVSRTQQYVINYTANGVNGTAQTFTPSTNGALKPSTLYGYNTNGGCLYVTTKTATSVVVRMRGWDYYTVGGSSPGVRVDLRQGTTSSGTLVSYNAGATITTLTNYGITFTGLSPNTTYSLWVYPTTPYGSNYKYQMGYVTVKTLPSAWSWTASNGSATAAQTQAANTAITGHGPLANFSYLVWNDLCDKVNAVVTAAGYSWSTQYATLANTKMSASSKNLTAVRFNSLRYNVGSHYSTGINEVAAGDQVLGSYFTTLTTKLNEWLATLS